RQVGRLGAGAHRQVEGIDAQVSATVSEARRTKFGPAGSGGPMNIHEYQAKKLLAGYGVRVLKGGVAYTPAEAEHVAADLHGPVWVVKSQIHAGGRGKGQFKGAEGQGGGVRIAKSTEEVRRIAQSMLGHVLVTKQTGGAGKEVRRVYIEEGCDIKRELYLGMLI